MPTNSNYILKFIPPWGLLMLVSAIQYRLLPVKNTPTRSFKQVDYLYAPRIILRHAITIMIVDYTADDEIGMRTALEEARKGLAEGGIPIGSALIVRSRSGQEPLVLSQGHNQRFQKDSAILHAEMDCLEQKGRMPASAYRGCTMYTTLSPCDMCTGAILLYGIPRVVIGENVNFLGGEDLLRERGVKVIVLDDEDCRKLMAHYILENPDRWNEDIGHIPDELRIDSVPHNV